MNPDDVVNKQIEDFNQRLTAMAYHQQQAMARQLIEQARRLREEGRNSPAEPKMLRTRAWQWLNERVAAVRKQQKPTITVPPGALEDVVEVEYTVIDEASHTEGHQQRTTRP